LTKSLTIQMLRNVVKNKAFIEQKFPDASFYEEIENENRGTEVRKDQSLIIDMQTANVLVIAYDAIKKQKNKEKFELMLKTWTNFQKLVKFAWTCVK